MSSPSPVSLLLSTLAGLSAVFCSSAPAQDQGSSRPDTCVIPSGEYAPIVRSKGEPEKTPVPAFRLAIVPATNAEFLGFVRANPQWQRSRASALFVDVGYLSHWAGDLELGSEAPPNSPVVRVSWFAARAYVKWVGARLPLTAEWELAAGAGFSRKDSGKDKIFVNYVLDWLAHPTPAILPAVGSTPPNFYGVKDLQGLVWEWVEDFNTALVTGESRGDTGLERNLFCGAGSIGAKDRDNYPAFMRAAYRSSLNASYCIGNLGFRCAYSL